MEFLEVDIIVENKLIKEKREINVYHRSTRGAHIISRGSSITLPLGTIEEEDYLHISLVSGAGYLWQHCLLDLPSWADFELSSEAAITLTHSGDRILLKISPGPPTWQLKITMPNGLSSMVPSTGDHVTISDG